MIDTNNFIKGLVEEHHLQTHVNKLLGTKHALSVEVELIDSKLEEIDTELENQANTLASCLCVVMQTCKVLESMKADLEKQKTNLNLQKKSTLPDQE